MELLKTVLRLLIDRQPLPAAYRDHALKGEWKSFRDLHIEPDWLLLYRIEGDELQLARTGTHADLFDEWQPSSRRRSSFRRRTHPPRHTPAQARAALAFVPQPASYSANNAAEHAEGPK